MNKSAICILFLASQFLSAQSSIQATDEIKKVYSDYGASNSTAYAGSIIEEDSILFLGSYGIANLQYQDKCTKESTFQIGSFAQQLVVLGILLLEEDNRLSQEDYLSKYFKLNESLNDIRIEHLVNHSSGLNDVGIVKKIAGYNKSDRFSMAKALHLISSQKQLNQKPGTKFSSTHSKSEMILMVKLVEEVTGKSFQEFASENIFEKLNMEHSVFETESNHSQKKVTAYSKNEDSFVEVDDVQKNTFFFNLRSSIADLTKWYSSFYTASPTKLQKLIQQLDTPVSLENGQTLISANGEMTLGREFLHLERGIPKYWQYSLTNGFGTNVFRFPNQKLISIGLTSDNTYAGRLAMTAIEPLMKEHYELPEKIDFDKIKTKPLSSKDQKEIEGHYWVFKNAYGTRIFTSNDTLFYGYMGDDYKIALKHLGNLRFQQVTNSDDEVFVEFKKEKGNMKLEESYSSSTPVIYEKIEFSGKASEISYQKLEGYYLNEELNIVLNISEKDGILKLNTSKIFDLELIPIQTNFFRTHLAQFRSIAFNEKNGSILLEINTTGIHSLEFKKISKTKPFKNDSYNFNLFEN